MAAATADRASARAQLDDAARDAWAEYLESTRRQDEFRYDDVEPWAWARLQRRLKIIGARRKSLK